MYETQQVANKRICEFCTIFDQGSLKSIKGGIFLSKTDHKFSQILVVDAQVIVQLRANFRHQRQVLELSELFRGAGLRAH